MGLLNDSWTVFRFPVGTANPVIENNSSLLAGTADLTFTPAGGQATGLELVAATSTTFETENTSYRAVGRAVRDHEGELLVGYIKKKATGDIDTIVGIEAPSLAPNPSISAGRYAITSVGHQARRVLTDQAELLIRVIKEASAGPPPVPARWEVVLASANGALLIWTVDAGSSITGLAANNPAAEISLHPIRHLVTQGTVQFYSLAGNFTWKNGMPTGDEVALPGGGAPESDSFTAVAVGTPPAV